jgi:predicted nucleic acid-binding protein
MRLALDTNVLAYAEGVNGATMQDVALAIVSKLPTSETFLPLQVLGELFNLLVRKSARSQQQARSSLLVWQDAFPVIEISRNVMLTAIDLASGHHFKIWDAVILSAASSAGCRLLLSEDLQDGFTWNGVTVVNPFSKTPHELLAEALNL